MRMSTPDQKDEESQSIFPVPKSAVPIFEAVRAKPELTRAQLQTVTGQPQQTTHRLCEALVDRGLIETLASAKGSPGKPSPRLRLKGDGAFAFGILIDTHSIEVGWVNLPGQLIWHRVLDCPANNPEATLRNVVGSYKESLKELAIPQNRITGAGVSMQGWRWQDPFRFFTPQPLREWEGIQVREFFATPLEIPIHPGNNATLGAKAEQWLGAGKNHRTFAYLSFNFGFGGGMVINGKLHEGAYLNAGEVSSIYDPTQRDRRPALANFIRTLRDHGIEIDGVRDLRERFDPEWPGVTEWIESIRPMLHLLLRAIWGLTDPSAIVFGGEAPSELKRLLIEASDGFESWGTEVRPLPNPLFLASEIPGGASLIGAALHSLETTILESGK